MKSWHYKFVKHILVLIKVSLFIFSIYFLVNTVASILIPSYAVVGKLFLLLSVFHFLRIVRTYFLIFFSYSIKDLKFSCFCYYSGLAFGIVTPGRVGELYRLKLIRDNVPGAYGVHFLFYEKASDLISVLVVALFAGMAFFDVRGELVFTNIILALGGLSLVLSKLERFKFLNFGVGKRLKEKYKISDSKDYGVRNILFLNIFTTVSWLIFIVLIHVSLADYYQPNFYETLVIYVFNSIATALPITFMGYGLREIFLSYMLDNVSPDIIGLITINFTLIYLFSFIMGICVYGQWKKCYEM